MKNNLTYEVLDQLCLSQAGVDLDRIDPRVRRELINALVFKVWEKRKEDPFYRFTLPLVVAADTETLCTVGATHPGTGLPITGTPVISGFSATTITRNAGSFPTGALLALTFIRTGIIAGLARVTSGGATATFELLAGFMTDYVPATDALLVDVMRSQSALSADISIPYLDKVIRVYDSVTRPTQGDFDIVLSGEDFSNLKYDRLMASRIAAYHRGTILDFFVGSQAISLGVVMMEYAGKPGLFTASTPTDTILIPPEDNAGLIAELTDAYIKIAKAPAIDQTAKA